MASERSTVKIQSKSLEQALVKAAGSLGVVQDDLAYKVLKDQSSKGIFSIFKSSSVEIEAWKKSDEKAERPRSSNRRGDRDNRRSRNQRTTRPARTETVDAADRKELTADQRTELIDELKSFCAGICSRIVEKDVEVTSTENEGRLVLNIHCESMAEHISKNTKLAEAMEHILRKKPRHLRQELPFRIFVDVEGHRIQREEELVQMAVDLSTKVCENKRPIVLNYKSSYDRKIIHMALDGDERVYTKSIGSGPNRKLMILPTKEEGAEAAEV